MRAGLHESLIFLQRDIEILIGDPRLEQYFKNASMLVVTNLPDIARCQATSEYLDHMWSIGRA
jgi:hypothetical protein